MLLWDMHAVILSILGEITKGDQQIMTSQEDAYGYVIDHSIDTQREEYITNQLVAFNRTHTTALATPPITPSPLQVYVLDALRRTVGGLIGRTNSVPQWLEISVIWIEESTRGHGIGRRLMEEAEREGRQRGCRYARLVTSNFQAPEFYRKLGYIAYGTLENCPPGETNFYLWKELEPHEPTLG
jgi:ribosomal protein S18 acetylase RimI-like enzyme